MRLQAKLNTSLLHTIKTCPQAKTSVALLHCQMSVYVIYVEHILSHNWKLKNTNIDFEEKCLDEMVSYNDKRLCEQLSVK